jgi:hypothetical protein
MSSSSARPSRVPAEKVQPTRVHSLLVLRSKEYHREGAPDGGVGLDTRARSILATTDEDNSLQEYDWDMTRGGATTSAETSWEHALISEFAGAGQKYMLQFDLLNPPDPEEEEDTEEARGETGRLVTGTEDGVVRYELTRF